MRSAAGCITTRLVVGFLAFAALPSVSSASPTTPSVAAEPLSLFFCVISRDNHERMCQLGYAHFAPPAEAGVRDHELAAWRLAEGRTDALCRFFVGGAKCA